MTASKIRTEQNHEHTIETRNAVYMLQDDRSPLDDRRWTEISCQYKAQGGERYLVLGNFDDDRKTKVSGAIENDTFKNPHVDFAYYYIDDVCVTNTKTNFSCNCANERRGAHCIGCTNPKERIQLGAGGDYGKFGI